MSEKISTELPGGSSSGEQSMPTALIQLPEGVSLGEDQPKQSMPTASTQLPRGSSPGEELAKDADIEQSLTKKIAVLEEKLQIKQKTIEDLHDQVLGMGYDMRKTVAAAELKQVSQAEILKVKEAELLQNISDLETENTKLLRAKDALQIEISSFGDENKRLR